MPPSQKRVTYGMHFRLATDLMCDGLLKNFALCALMLEEIKEQQVAHRQTSSNLLAIYYVVEMQLIHPLEYSSVLVCGSIILPIGIFLSR